MNLSTLTDFAALFANDPSQTRFSGHYTKVLNQAQQQFALDTKALFKDQQISVVSGTAAYSLNTDFMFEKKVTHDGLKLDPITRADLEFYKRSDDWTDDEGTPKYYIIDPEEARKQILLYPEPQGEDAGTNNLVLTYYPLPTDLSASGDIPLNSSLLLVQFHIAIAALGAWYLLMMDPSTPENMAKKSDLIKLYQSKVTEAIDRFGNTISSPLRLKGGRSWR